MAIRQGSDSSENPARLSPVNDAALSPEVYRQIYVSLDLGKASQPVVGVTSAIGGEGRTTVSMGLAATLANDLGFRVVLVEADLERSIIAQRFRMSPTPGLADVLRSGGRLADVMRPASENLFVVTAGTVQEDTSRLLHKLPLRDPFHDPHLGPHVTIIDLPPIVNHSYSPLVARIADALLLVVRAGVTPAEVVREAVSRLEERPPRGVVLNGATSAMPNWWPGGGL